MYPGSRRAFCQMAQPNVPVSKTGHFPHARLVGDCVLWVHSSGVGSTKALIELFTAAHYLLLSSSHAIYSYEARHLYLLLIVSLPVRLYLKLNSHLEQRNKSKEGVAAHKAVASKRPKTLRPDFNFLFHGNRLHLSRYRHPTSPSVDTDMQPLLYFTG
jgi:hypothetical protein